MKSHRVVIGMLFLVIYLCSCETEVNREYYSNGTLKEEYSMKNGKIIGNYKSFFENGRTRSTGEYENGLMSGSWVDYYPNGIIQSIQKFEDGKLIYIDFWDRNGNQTIKNGNGIGEIYNSSGQIITSMSYANNVLHGKCESWHSNGQKASEFYYEKGKRIGVWSFWNEYGELIKTEKY